VSTVEPTSATTIKKLEELSVTNGANTSPHKPSSMKNSRPASKAHASVAPAARSQRTTRMFREMTDTSAQALSVRPCTAGTMKKPATTRMIAQTTTDESATLKVGQRSSPNNP